MKTVVARMAALNRVAARGRALFHFLNGAQEHTHGSTPHTHGSTPRDLLVAA
jgi:hypothetical protein